MRPGRIPKDPSRELRELETHLHFVRQDLKALVRDPDHVKRLAAELRLLICRTGRNDQGLIWRLAETHRVDDQVHVHAPGEVNRDHPLARGLRISAVPLQRPNAEVERQLPSGMYSFKEIVEDFPAIWVLGMRSYTHAQLIRAVAEQTGSAHEDPGIDPGLADAETHLFGQNQVYVPVIVMDAHLTLEVGERVLWAAARTANYLRARFAEPLSLTLVLRPLEEPLGEVPVCRFYSYIQAVEITGSLSRTSFAWTVTRPPHSWRVECPAPPGGRLGDDIGFTLVYEDRQTQLTATSATSAQTMRPCDLGELRTDLAFGAVGGATPYFIRRAGLVHDRVISSHELANVHGLIVDPPLETL